MQHLHFHTHTHTFNFLYYLNNSLLITATATVTATVTAIMDLKVGSVFEDIPVTKAAIKTYLADAAKL